MNSIDFFSQDQFAARAGIRLLSVGPGYAMAEMPITPHVLNASGFCQGGAIFTLADLTFAAAVNTHERLTVSVNSSIVFLRGVDHGTLHAEARELANHPKLPFAEVRITDDEGQLVAMFTGSGYRKRAALPFTKPE